MSLLESGAALDCKNSMKLRLYKTWKTNFLICTDFFTHKLKLTTPSVKHRILPILDLSLVGAY